MVADPIGAPSAGRVRRPEHLDLDRLVDDRATHVIVCCGSGGVGKTTTAAALALRAAAHGRHVVVLTIDPAKRLAQSMGLEELDNEPRVVPGAVDPASGGELQAMMLDMRRTFDEMVLGHTTPDRAQAIFDNPFYQTISSSFSGTQEYMAMEKLGQLAATGRWDLIIVDTPPSRSGAGLPRRAAATVVVPRRPHDPAALGTRPGRRLALRKLVGSTFDLFAKAVSTILGGQMLSNASAFVQAFDTLFGAFQERADARPAAPAPGTAFVVVASPSPTRCVRRPTRRRARPERMPLAGLVLDRNPPGPRHAFQHWPARRPDPRGRARRRDNSGHAGLPADRVETAERERACWPGSPRPIPRSRSSTCPRWRPTSTASRACAVGVLLTSSGFEMSAPREPTQSPTPLPARSRATLGRPSPDQTQR